LLKGLGFAEGGWALISLELAWNYCLRGCPAGVIGASGARARLVID